MCSLFLNDLFCEVNNFLEDLRMSDFNFDNRARGGLAAIRRRKTTTRYPYELVALGIAESALVRLLALELETAKAAELDTCKLFMTVANKCHQEKR